MILIQTAAHMFHHTPLEKVKNFLNSRSKTTVERHQTIVYLLHSAIVVIVIAMQLMGLGGSQEVMPQAMSIVHLTACLTALTLFFARRVSAPMALSVVALVSQVTIVCRFVYFSHVRPEHFLQLIILNQMVSLMAVVLLVMCFVRYTPSVVAAISLVAYGSVTAYLKEPALWKLFGFFLGVEFLLCVLGELLRRNVQHVQKENVYLHHRETALMRAVRLNEQEIEAYLCMSSNNRPLPEDTDRLFAMLKPTSQRNLINAVRLHLKNHLTDDDSLARHLPTLTKSEVDVCNLILQGKKRGEICRLLDKTEKNVDVVRTHVRKKLNVPTDQDLQKFLFNLLIEKEYLNKGERK